MDPMGVAGMIFTLLLFMLIGGFIVLFPLTRRLGSLLESKLQKEKQPVIPGEQLNQLREMIEGLAREVERLAERQEFTDRLLSSRGRTPLSAGPVTESDASEGGS